MMLHPQPALQDQVLEQEVADIEHNEPDLDLVTEISNLAQQVQDAYIEKTTEYNNRIKVIRMQQNVLYQFKTDAAFRAIEMENSQKKCALFEQMKQNFKNLQIEYRDLIKLHTDDFIQRFTSESVSKPEQQIQSLENNVFQAG